ncbi:hypothetical protein FACS18947_5230 [Bacteroidia bacterium]|nr:hypothetical protein FACS18947_5230 [Bacteroidia bacterium]
MKKAIPLFLACLLITSLFTGCSGSKPASDSTEIPAINADENASDEMKLAMEFISAQLKFLETGAEWEAEGMYLQANHAYSYVMANLFSLRLCASHLLAMAGESGSLEELIGERQSSWNTIASLNYSAPYPWLFESAVEFMRGDTDKSSNLYDHALLNPRLKKEVADTLFFAVAGLPVSELKTLKEELEKLEDQLNEAHPQEYSSYTRDPYVFDDAYLRAVAQDALNADNTDAALAACRQAVLVNPFEGDNFLVCATIELYLFDDLEQAFYYVNEGLDADPEHKALNAFAEELAKGGEQ